jgi:hypothetical protein
VSNHGGAGRKWHAAVFAASDYLCQAETHAPGCNGFPTEAHHIVYRAHLTESALWVFENGAALSLQCHQLAHASHNANLADDRLMTAVDAVNAIQGDMPGQRVPYFFKKAVR